jgi:hypothetical protein
MTTNIINKLKGLSLKDKIKTKEIEPNLYFMFLENSATGLKWIDAVFAYSFEEARKFASETQAKQIEQGSFDSVLNIKTLKERNHQASLVALIANNRIDYYVTTPIRDILAKALEFVEEKEEKT